MTIWDKCGMARSREGLTEALEKIPQIREEFWENVLIPGSGANANMELEKAGRVADFIEFGEIMCYDALDREESCGGHFRVEHQFFDNSPEVIAGSTQAGEARRDDANFAHVSAWEYNGPGNGAHAPQGAARLRGSPRLHPQLRLIRRKTVRSSRLVPKIFRRKFARFPPGRELSVHEMDATDDSALMHLDSPETGVAPPPGKNHWIFGKLIESTGRIRANALMKR